MGTKWIGRVRPWLAVAGAAAPSLVVLAGGSAQAAPTPACDANPAATCTLTVAPADGAVAFTVPTNMTTLDIVAIGGCGGSDGTVGSAVVGHNGARVENGALGLAAGTILDLFAGAAGDPATPVPGSDAIAGAGGLSGGGAGVGAGGNGGSPGAGGGGAASEVKIRNGADLLVAGGGGGAGGQNALGGTGGYAGLAGGAGESGQSAPAPAGGAGGVAGAPTTSVAAGPNGGAGVPANGLSPGGGGGGGGGAGVGTPSGGGTVVQSGATYLGGGGGAPPVTASARQARRSRSTPHAPTAASC